MRKTTIMIVGEDDWTTALERLKVEKLKVVILDSSVCAGEAAESLTAICHAGLPSRCLVICSDAAQTNAVSDIGADVAVVEGIPAMELASCVRDLAMKEDR